jgi:putative two-component system response regulator
MSGRNYTILFADDEPWLTESLRLSLESRGYQCISTTNASEAWEYIETHEVDVLVTDIMMPAEKLFPDVDSSVAGFSLVRRVRNRSKHQSIICLSVIADVERIDELKRQNVLYIRKGETPLSTALRLIESKATGLISFDRK